MDALSCDTAVGDACHWPFWSRLSIRRTACACSMQSRRDTHSHPALPCRIERCLQTSIHPCRDSMNSTISAPCCPDVMRMMSGKVAECVRAID